jgi:hypothetical protein
MGHKECGMAHSPSVQAKKTILKTRGGYMNKRFVLTAVLASLTLTAACETIPYAERVRLFEESVNARFVGKSVDELVLALGPPQSSFKLSDGRDVLQYEVDRMITTGGGSYTSYETVNRDRRVRDPDGTVRVIQDRQTIPVQNNQPIQTFNQLCKRRFVVDQNKQVVQFNWEGNACF